MNEREIFSKFNEDLSELVVSWGYGDDGFSDMYSKAVKWLTNFDIDEIEDAFKIMCNIKVIHPATIQTAIRNLAENIRAKIGVKTFVISSLEGRAGSSGSQFLYLLSKELLIPESRVLNGEIEKIVDDNKIVVLIDDIVGSGGEAIDIWNKIKQKDSEVYYCPILCFKNGMEEIIRNDCFTAFMPQKILGMDEKAFGEKSRYFPNVEERERLKRLALKYGSELYPKHPLGYKDTQAMIAWGTTCQAPNNSLPIIWAGPRNESKRPWNPLFQRSVSNSETNIQKMIPKRSVSDKVAQTKGTPNQPITSEELINQADYAIGLHCAGDVSGYRSFLSKNKITNKLKRAALFEKLRDLAYVDLDLSLRTRYARSVLAYIQSCLVLCEIESAIDVIQRKLATDPWLKTYSVIDKEAFLRTYAEILSEAGRADLSATILESLLNSGLVRKLPHSHLSHMLSCLGGAYLAIDNLDDAYVIAQDNYDEQRLTKNEYGLAISGTRLGIALLASNKPSDAISLFEASAAVFNGFDQRACAWAKLYCHVCALRLGDARTNHLDFAMDFYSKVNHSSKELLRLIQEAQTAGIGWCHDYDEILNKISDLVAKCEISSHYLDTAEDFCSAFIARPVFPGANAINHRVSRGEFRQNSILTSSFLKSLNDNAKNEYLDKITSTERFYERPFYNKLIRHLTDQRPDLVKKIVFPKLDRIRDTRDTFRVYYARLLEHHDFTKEADFLLDSVEDKTQFRYLNNKANILARQRSTLDDALYHYRMAVDATENDQEKSIAYHNQALAILRKNVKSKYEEAEAFCRLSLNLRLNEAFLAPAQTLLLLRIDKENQSSTADILAKCQEEFSLTSRQLRRIINEIKNRKKYVEAEKFLLNID